MENDDVEKEEEDVEDEEEDDNDHVEDDNDGEVDDDDDEATAQKLGPHFVGACAIDLHLTRATLHGKLQVKCRRPEARTTLCATLRSRYELQHVTRATLYRNLQEKCRGPE